MLRQRVITAIVGLPIFIAAIWFGNPWFTIMAVAIAVIGGFEFHRMTNNGNILSLSYFSILISALLVISPLFDIASLRIHLISLALVISLIWVLFRRPMDRAFLNWAWVMAGMLYIGWTLSYWIDLRMLTSGKGWIFWISFIVIVNDTAAFFIGKAFGKHPLSPTISPNKTWEGSIGGLLSGIIIAVILAVLFNLFPVSWQMALPINYWQMIILGSIIGIVAQMGDLIESLLKRNTGVKDSGKLLPGHGGLLDRVDSFILTGITAYYFITFLVI
jgi:phosphatidate cytidylyltransferase